MSFGEWAFGELPWYLFFNQKSLSCAAADNIDEKKTKKMFLTESDTFGLLAELFPPFISCFKTWLMVSDNWFGFFIVATVQN
jgi:hypothetical protein